MSPEYKMEAHKIYIDCRLYPMAIGYEKDGLLFSTPHLFYERFTKIAWQKRFSKEERQGYLTRRRLRDERERLAETEYTIHEPPIEPEKPDTTPFSPKRENPRSEKPYLGRTGTGFTYLGKSRTIKYRYKQVN